MVTKELLEKAADRLVRLARVRNICPKGEFSTELGAMHDLLSSMGFDLDFFWDDDSKKITGLSLSLDGYIVERTV